MPRSSLENAEKPDLRPQPNCGATNESWETALIMARSCIRDLIWKECRSSEQRAQVQSQISTAVEEYVRSIIQVKKRSDNGKTVFWREFINEPLAAVEPLRRLLTSHTPRARARALTELPIVAIDALRDAAHKIKNKPLHSIMLQWPTIPGTPVNFDSGELAELVPAAIQIARSYGNRNSVRDRTIVAILRQFASLRGSWPSKKEADRFILAVHACYAELLPQSGFDIESAGTIYRALARAKATDG